jgi:hypothetical protein
MGRLAAVLANNTLSRKFFRGTNTPPYFVSPSETEKKSFITSTIGQRRRARDAGQEGSRRERDADRRVRKNVQRHGVGAQEVDHEHAGPRCHRTRQSSRRRRRRVRRSVTPAAG